MENEGEVYKMNRREKESKKGVEEKGVEKNKRRDIKRITYVEEEAEP